MLCPQFPQGRFLSRFHFLGHLLVFRANLPHQPVDSIRYEIFGWRALHRLSQDVQRHLVPFTVMQEIEASIEQ